MKYFILVMTMIMFLNVHGQQVEKTFPAYIDTVSDGDTYWVITKYQGKKQRIKVRLANVDCPELYFVSKKRPAQPYAEDAKKNISLLIQHKTVSLTFYYKNQNSKATVDYFGRPLVFIKIGKERLDDLIIYNGWGWYDNTYHTTKPYQHGSDLMEIAKMQKHGLWELPHPIKPSDWRKGIMLIPQILPKHPKHDHIPVNFL